jgi:(2Fe-2S) ferredoxin
MMRLLAPFIVAVCAACTTAPPFVPSNAPATVAPAQVKVGDFWEYRVKDAYTGFDRGLFRYEVSHADASRVVVDVSRDGERIDSLIYAAGWNGLELPLTNLQRFRYEPALPAYAYPLEPGKTWYTVVNATDPVTRRTNKVHTRGKVVGWERIRVPAGEFDALRIERYVYAGNSDAVKTQEEILETDWYVPALRRAARTQASSQHFDNSRGGGDGGGEYPLRIRGDWLVAELVRSSP